MSVSSMKKLTVFAFCEDTDAMLSHVLSMGCVQFADNTPTDEALEYDTFDCSAERADIEERLSVIRQAMDALYAQCGKRRRSRRLTPQSSREQFVADGEDKRTFSAVERTLALCEEQVHLKAEMKSTEELLASLVPWLDYDAPLNEVSTQSTKTVFGSFRGKKDIQSMLDAIEEAGAYLEIVSVTKTRIYLAITFHLMDEANVTAMLSDGGFAQEQFPHIDEAPHRVYDRGTERLETIKNKLMDLDERLMDLSEFLDEMQMLAAIEEFNLEACIRKQALASTQSCVMLEGWIPSSMEDAVVQSLSEIDCAFELEDVEDSNLPPALQRNKLFASCFSWLSKKKAPSGH